MRDAIVDAKSGVSGAGREATGTTHFVSVDENVNAYKVEGHRHRAELEQELGVEVPITFTPHLFRSTRGCSRSCYVTPRTASPPRSVRDLFREAYEDEPFIELADSPPGVRDVRETNLCRIHATVEPATGRVLVFSRDRQPLEGRRGAGACRT